MDLIKYDMTDIWASAGDVVAPDSAKINQGWGVEVVPRQWWNWFENRQDNNLAYLLQKGFPEWDATTEYIINKSYVQRNGVVYKATTTNTNSDPTALTSWVRAFADYSASLAAVGALTPAAGRMIVYNDATTASTFQTAAYGRGILNQANGTAVLSYIGGQPVNTNLTALSGVTASANALPYFTGTTAMGVTTLTSFGRSLIDDNDAATARTTLGLGTAAVANLTTSPTDNTAGRVLQVGDFGLGAETLSDIDPNTIGTSRFFRAFNSPNMPTLGTWAGLHINREAGGRAVQMAWEDATSRTYQRTRSSGGVWGAWVEFWTGSNLVKTSSSVDRTAGRITKVGDFGLGDVAIPVTGVDIDSINTLGTGFYEVSSTETWANRPVPDKWFRIHHIAHNNPAGYWTQVAYSFDAAQRIFTRFMDNGTLGAWVEQIHTGNATTTGRTALGLNAAATAPVTGSGNAVMSNSPTFQGVPVAPTAPLGTNTTQLATTQFVLANSTSNPSGTILAYAGSVVPAGYLLANGSVVNRTTYADLFAAIGTTYGAGDGSTTFSIPDLRGEFLRGLDNGRGVDSSRTLGSFQNHQFASHSHTFTGNAYGGHNHDGGTSNVYHDHTLTGAWADAQGNHAHNVGLSSSSSGGASSADGNGVGPTANLVTDYQGTHTHNVYGSTTGHNHTHVFTTNWGGAFTPTGSISLNGGTTNGSETRPRNVAVQFLIKF